jgi:hypothetical protein
MRKLLYSTRLVNYTIDREINELLRNISQDDEIPETVYIRLAIGRFLENDRNPIFIENLKKEIDLVPRGTVVKTHKIHIKRLGNIDDIADAVGCNRSRLMNHIIKNFLYKI